jgi:thymidylate synthase
MRKLYGELSKSTDTFEASKGKGQDLLGQKIVLKDPRARISATATRGRLISALAEFCWYMAGSADLDFIRFYLPDYPPKGATGALEEAYGPRLIGTGEFGHSFDQIERVIDRLRRKPDTRRAVISILEPSDLEPGKAEAPCTIALQFIRRRERLHLVAMMRSNDAYLGFPHDVFCFTMIQELIARSLGIQVGEYHHFATSLHLYEHDQDKVSAYLDEGFQSPTFAMPKMPSGCQLANLKAFLDAERSIRSGTITAAAQIKLPQYWRDLALVLLRLADSRFRRGQKMLDKNFSSINSSFYRNFFIRRPKMLPKSSAFSTTQSRFDLGDDDAAEN